MFKIYKVEDAGMDGRGGRLIGYFSTLSLAQKHATGRGAMGCGDGHINAIEVIEAQGEIDAKDKEEALQKLTHHERKLLGLE